MDGERMIQTEAAAPHMTCSMCGHRFDPAQNVACGACPLSGGCQLVCCPACGFEQVNPDRSAVVRFFKNLKKRMQ
ncbi:MAG: hypothetical protein ACKOC5_16125 [Chloroflexota bacterium]